MSTFGSDPIRWSKDSPEYESFCFVYDRLGSDLDQLDEVISAKAVPILGASGGPAPTKKRGLWARFRRKQEKVETKEPALRELSAEELLAYEIKRECLLLEGLCGGAREDEAMNVYLETRQGSLANLRTQGAEALQEFLLGDEIQMDHLFVAGEITDFAEGFLNACRVVVDSGVAGDRLIAKMEQVRDQLSQVPVPDEGVSEIRDRYQKDLLALIVRLQNKS